MSCVALKFITFEAERWVVQFEEWSVLAIDSSIRLNRGHCIRINHCLKVFRCQTFFSSIWRESRGMIMWSFHELEAPCLGTSQLSFHFNGHGTQEFYPITLKRVLGWESNAIARVAKPDKNIWIRIYSLYQKGGLSQKSRDCSLALDLSNGHKWGFCPETRR